MVRLLLASDSPRRAALLAEGGFDFETVSPRVAEKFDVDLTLRELTMWNAIQRDISRRMRVPISAARGADTLIALEGKIIGKPADLSEAARILRRLSGRTHEVCSAVFVCHFAAGRSASIDEISHVRFRRLSATRIDNYLERVDPLDKAGAYAAQGEGA
jgi:septum formation protein